MTEQGRFHAQIVWAKERLDEMDASLDALQRRVDETRVAARGNLERSINNLRNRRDEFRQTMKTAKDVGMAEWTRQGTRLKSQWSEFEDELNKTMEAFGAQVAVRRAVFRDLIAAQQSAWRDAAKSMRSSTAGFARDCRNEIEQVVQSMKANESKAEARLKDMNEAGSESWEAMKGALAKTRSAFDRSIKAAEKAFQRPEKTGAESKPQDRRPH